MTTIYDIALFYPRFLDCVVSDIICSSIYVQSILLHKLACHSAVFQFVLILKIYIINHDEIYILDKIK